MTPFFQKMAFKCTHATHTSEGAALSACTDAHSSCSGLEVDFLV